MNTEVTSGEKPREQEEATSPRLDKLRELVTFLKESNIVEFSSERDGEKLSLKFASQMAAPTQIDPGVLAALTHSAAALPTPNATVAAHAVAPPQGAPPAAAAPAEVPPAASEENSWHIVKSPIVGTFYESASPGTPAFVNVGDQVEQGQVLCIIEAMKLMNEIESDGAGEVVKRFVQNNQPVEYGQHLYALKPRS